MVKRTTIYPIDPLFLRRWSPRAMSGEPITKMQLFTLFEAARWAPSSYNNQPWRFIYAMRDTKEWKTLFDLLVPFNQSWCINAGALIVIVAHKVFSYNNKPSITHALDTGAAWMSFALQGTISGLVVHGMEGFDYKKAQEVLNIPSDYTVLAMAAIGKPGDVSRLPADLQQREESSDRLPLEELVFGGFFGNKST